MVSASATEKSAGHSALRANDTPSKWPRVSHTASSRCGAALMKRAMSENGASSVRETARRM